MSAKSFNSFFPKSEDMPSSILAPSNFGSLADDIQFHRELTNQNNIERNIYFDTSGIIDMLTGLSGLLQGGKINWSVYHRPSTIVNALAYRNWLGAIYLLPPHTEELIRQIQENERLFPNYPAKSLKVDEEEFWAELDLKVQDFKEAIDNPQAMEKWVDELKSESTDFFKGVYLSSSDGFWKARYKYLKDKGILNLSDEGNYPLGDITEKPLFKRLHKRLNEKRNKNWNNYLDAIALCQLDEKLKQFNKNRANGRPATLPLFFSDQPHILDAVEDFSRSPDQDGHYSFTYRSENSENANFLIVRNSGFFTIDGIFNAILQVDPKEKLEDFLSALEQLPSNESNYSGKKILPNLVGKNIVKNIRDDLHEPSKEKIFLEFFNRWWARGGYEELQYVLKDNSLEEDREIIDQQIQEYIEHERKRLNEEFSAYSDRISIIRSTWQQFNGLPEFIESNFSETNENLNIFKELGTRFSFTEKVCKEIQVLMDRMFWAIKTRGEDNSIELESAEAEVVTDLLVGLFEEAKTEKEKHDKLDRLAKSLGILWVFEKYEPISKVCKVIRKQFAANDTNNDLYPSATIALIHAASLLKGREKDEQATLNILNCVETKFGQKNYKIWIGLSYLYFLLWDQRVDSHRFPEVMINRKETRQEQKDSQYLQKALEYSEKAVLWLEERRKEAVEPKKQINRQRKYYYALNVYLYLKTYQCSSDEFIELIHYVDKFEQIARNADYWDDARFSDTLSRYFFRLALLSENREEYKLYIQEARLNNQSAINSSKRIKKPYLTLSRILREAEIKGPSYLKILRARRERY